LSAEKEETNMIKKRKIMTTAIFKTATIVPIIIKTL